MPVFAVLAMALFIRQTEPNVNTVVGTTCEQRWVSA